MITTFLPSPLLFTYYVVVTFVYPLFCLQMNTADKISEGHYDILTPIYFWKLTASPMDVSKLGFLGIFVNNGPSALKFSILPDFRFA